MYANFDSELAHWDWRFCRFHPNLERIPNGCLLKSTKLNGSAAAFLYLGLHGTYTMLWVIKQSLFADKRFAQPIPLRIGLLIPFCR
jgi:hypothetical protein